jgi:hypothetical protein
MKRSSLLLVVLTALFLFLLSCDKKIVYTYKEGNSEFETTLEGKELIDKAMEAIEAGDCERAIEYADELIHLDPKSQGV